MVLKFTSGYVIYFIIYTIFFKNNEKDYNKRHVSNKVAQIDTLKKDTMKRRD